VCEGDGVVVSDATHALEIERRLRALAKGSRVQAFRVVVHPRVLTLLVGAGGARLEALEAAARRRFYLVPAAGNGHVHLDHFEVIGQGKLEALRPEAPVAEGANVELKLVEVGLYDPAAAVGKVGADYEVVVGDAAKLVGKKVTATIGRALDGVAYATLADATGSGQTPITFEAEAEKPTRALRGKKEAEVSDAPEVAEPSEELAAVDTVETAEIEAVADTPDEAAVNGQPKKKRTRRGSRGGRGRKKTGVEATEEAGAEGDGRAAPRIHIPPADLDAVAEDATEAVVETPGPEEGVAEAGADGASKRKRSRRGSRGGRKRRKAPTNGDEATTMTGEEHVGEEQVGEEQVAVADAPEYVPMSEWIDDFGSRP
jgi:hypothetical protein